MEPKFEPYKGDQWGELERLHCNKPAELPPSDGIPVVGVGPEDKTYERDVLEALLNDRTDTLLSNDAMPAIYTAFYKLESSNIEPEHVEQFLQRLPPLEDLESQATIWRILSFLSSNFSRMIAAYGIVEKADYSTLPCINEREIISDVCHTVSRAITADNKVEVYHLIFPHIITILKDPDRHKINWALENILELCIDFVPIIPQWDIESLDIVFDAFMVFNEHTESCVSSAAIQGATCVLHHHPHLTKTNVFLTGKLEQTIRRMRYLGGQHNVDLCESVVDFLTHLLDIIDKFPEQCYVLIADLICTVLRYTMTGYSRSHILFLFNQALVHEGFRLCRDVDLVYMIDKFVQEYECMKIQEKQEAVAVFSNILFVLKPDVIQEFLNSEVFVEALIDVFELTEDMDDELLGFLCGLCKALVHNQCVIGSDELRDRLIELISNVKENRIESLVVTYCNLILVALGVSL